jgi:hypothetical protein
LPLANEAQRRKLEVPRLLPHHQVQHDRHNRQNRAAEQCWSNEIHV